MVIRSGLTKVSTNGINIGHCKVQAVDCTPRVKCRPQTMGKMKTVEFN